MAKVKKVKNAAAVKKAQAGVVSAKAKAGFDELADEAQSLVKRITEDETLREAVEKLVAEADALKPKGKAAKKAAKKKIAEVQKPKKKGTLRRRLLLVTVGGIGALTVSEGLRSKVLDLLFGSEEEFEYTPPEPAPPVEPAPGTPPAAA